MQKPRDRRGHPGACQIMKDGAFRDSISLLFTRRFGVFCFASLLSNLGTWAQNVAQPWLLLSLGASPFLLGLDSFALGAPVWLATDSVEASGLWVAQDTGGAIKGANRFDSFWGAGPTARLIAGGMAARGDVLLLVPRGTLARLRAGTGAAVPPVRR